MNTAQFKFKMWIECSEKERDFFCGDEYLPLPISHRDRISVLSGPDARQFVKEALCQIPEYEDSSLSSKRTHASIMLHDVWCNKEKIQDVKQWLYDKGIAFSTRVFLLYGNRVVSTEWKILVNYWDSFAWNVGMAMVATDLTGRWACEFHHEDTITFYSYPKT